MMRMRRSSVLLLAGIAFLGIGCQPPVSAPPPAVPSAYAVLPDTLVCVIDRSTPRGLTEIPAKVGEAGVVLLADGQVQPLEVVHPTNMIAGYAGRETWLTQNEPISLDGRRYLRTGGERRVAIDLLVRAGEFRGVLLFAGQEDSPPVDALYVPTAPGCIFQAYVREDLMRR